MCIVYILDIGVMIRVFANGLEDGGSIPGWVIPKTQKMELDASLINSHHYKVRIKGKMEQSSDWSCALPYTLVTLEYGHQLYFMQVWRGFGIK